MLTNPKPLIPGVSIISPPICSGCISAKVVVCCPLLWLLLTAPVRRFRLGSIALISVLFPTPLCPLSRVVFPLSREANSDNPSPLVAEVSKTNPYLNEAITVVYKLYISPNTGVETWRELDNPRYADFWSQNINVKELKLINSTYNYVELLVRVFYLCNGH